MWKNDTRGEKLMKSVPVLGPNHIEVPLGVLSVDQNLEELLKRGINFILSGQINTYNNTLVAVFITTIPVEEK